MVVWHNELIGHEFEQALVESEGQGSLACCSQWDRKELDMTEELKNNSTARPRVLSPVSPERAGSVPALF